MKENLVKLGLSTDFGSPGHWERVIEFACQHDVCRLVYWGDYINNFRVKAPCLYPKYPKLLPEGQRKAVEMSRARFRQVAAMTADAGLELWCVFQALEIPAVNHARQVWPKLFNDQGEPDMSGELVYQLIRDQLDELFDLVPSLHGVELWVMEGAAVMIERLKRQRLPLQKIGARIVETVHDHVARSGRALAVDLHSQSLTRRGLFQAAVRHPDVIVSGDNVIGDFHLHLPFNAYVKRAAETNPVQVHFDLNGEYWGRNFIPTSALSQYASHIEEARALGAVYIDGRVATAHDRWSPCANVLPSRRRFYPALEGIEDTTPLPSDLEVACTDTLGGFNAEFFCRRAKDPKVKPEEVLEDFLVREFGAAAARLVPSFMKLEGTLAKLFFADKNYYGFQSVAPRHRDMMFAGLAVQLTCAPETEFPTPEALVRAERDLTKGSHIPPGHKCAGPEAMIREKEEALAEAEQLLQSVKQATEEFKAEDRDFLVKQFEDLVYYARAYRLLLEAQAHYYLTLYGNRRGELPDPARLDEVLKQMEDVCDEWEARYPGGRYLLAEILREWVEVIGEG